MTTPAFVGAILATAGSTTINATITGLPANASLFAAYAYGVSQPTTVAITGASGQFSCAATTIAVGEIMFVQGALPTYPAAGGIQGYVNPTRYKVGATNGSTTFTLTDIVGNPLTTAAGSPGGTFGLIGAATMTDSVGGTMTQVLGPTLSSGSQFYSWCLAKLLSQASGSHTVTCSNNSGFSSSETLLIFAYTGGDIDLAGVKLNGTFIGSGAGTNTGSSGSVTPSQNGCVIVGIGVTTNGTNVLTAGNSPIAFVSEFSTPTYIQIEDFTQSTAAPIAANFTLAGGNANDNIQSFIIPLAPFGVVGAQLAAAAGGIASAQLPFSTFTAYAPIPLLPNLSPPNTGLSFNADQASLQIFNPLVNFANNGRVAFSKVVTYAMSATVDSPTIAGDVPGVTTRYEITPSGPGFVLNGLTSTLTTLMQDGFTRLIYNASTTNSFNLGHNASAILYNGFNCPSGSAFTIPPRGCALLIYDATLNLTLVK